MQDNGALPEALPAADRFANRLDGPVGRRDKDDVGTGRDLLRPPADDAAADHRRGHFGRRAAAARQAGQGVTGIDQKLAQQGADLAASDNGDRRFHGVLSLRRSRVRRSGAGQGPVPFNPRLFYPSTLHLCYRLPPSWTVAGSLDLTARLDLNAAIAETDYSNNVLSTTVSFSETAPLAIKFFMLT